MTPVTTYKDGNRYSAAVAGAGVVAYQLPRAAVAAKIVAAGFSLADAEAMLDAPVSPAEWRATWASALTHDLAGISDDVTAIADRDRADAIESRLAAAMEMLADVHAQNADLLRIEEERREAADAARERILQQQEQQRLAAAEQAESAKWLDIRVTQNGLTLEVWKDVTEFVRFVGSNREPVFRKYSIRQATYSVVDAPADVRARVGVKPTRSKVQVPKEPHASSL